jgi:hypothetical protein
MDDGRLRRWNGGGKGPSQEHLKERFYFIQRALTTDRGLWDGEKEKTSKQGEGDGEGEKEGETAKDKAEAAAEAERQQRDNVMMTKPYDVEYEIQRKEYLDKAMSRQKGDEAVEQSIVEQARKIEAMLKKRKQDARKRKVAYPPQLSSPRCEMSVYVIPTLIFSFSFHGRTIPRRISRSCRPRLAAYSGAVCLSYQPRTNRRQCPRFCKVSAWRCEWP